MRDLSKNDPLKGLSDEDLTAKYRAAIVSEENARMRFSKNRSPKNGESHKRARERVGNLRSEMSLRKLPTSRF